MIDEIITEILRREGWDKFTNDPNDRGGSTKWGITQFAWTLYLKKRGLQSTSVEFIDEATARKFYLEEHIVGPRFDQLKDRLLFELVVDSGVNHGATRATRWLQTSVGAAPDGALGPVTLGLVSRRNPLVLTATIVAIRMRFYATLVVSDPSQLKFLAGWTNRAMGFLDRVAARLAAG